MGLRGAVVGVGGDIEVIIGACIWVAMAIVGSLLNGSGLMPFTRRMFIFLADRLLIHSMVKIRRNGWLVSWS